MHNSADDYLNSLQLEEALAIACKGGYTDIVRLLMEHEEDTDATVMCTCDLCYRYIPPCIMYVRMIAATVAYHLRCVSYLRVIRRLWPSPTHVVAGCI